MKRFSCILIAFSFTLVTVAQREIIIELEPFTEIKAFDRITTVLVKSDANKVVITGDDQDDVKISNKGGLLKIRMEFENQFDGGDVTAKVYYTEPLTLIDANENANISSDDLISGSEAKVAAQEGGKIRLQMAFDILNVKSTTGGEITLTGKVKKQEAVANSGGRIHNEALQTAETKITVNAGGSARVHATEKMEAKVRAGGYIGVYGNPKDLKRDKVFGGKIKVIE